MPFCRLSYRRGFPILASISSGVTGLPFSLNNAPWGQRISQDGRRTHQLGNQPVDKPDGRIGGPIGESFDASCVDGISEISGWRAASFRDQMGGSPIGSLIGGLISGIRESKKNSRTGKLAQSVKR